jgi:hypothetical protein
MKILVFQNSHGIIGIIRWIACLQMTLYTRPSFEVNWINNNLMVVVKLAQVNQSFSIH